MDRHLSDEQIEALAHAREELVSDEALTHLASCDACASNVMVSRALSHSVGLQLRDEYAASDFAVDDLVSAVLSQTQPQPVAAPARGTLLTGSLGGLSLALTTGALSGVRLPSRWPSLTGAYEGLRIARSIMGAIDEQVVSHLPGGWGLVMAGAWVMLAVLMLPARMLLVRARLSSPRLISMALMLVALLVSVQPVSALDFEGELPEQKRVSLNVTREPTSKVLGRVADLAGLSLVITLPDDPLVTLRVKQASLREVLTAVLGEQPVTVTVQGKMLVVRQTKAGAPTTSAPASAAGTSASDAAPIVTTPVKPEAQGPGKVPHAVTVPPIPPVPGVPAIPALPLTAKKRATDRVVMGGSSTVAAGQHVRDAIVVGGNLTVYGVVEGDAVAIGGHIHLMPGSLVRGELLAVGGAVTQEPGATVSSDADDADKDEDEDEDQDEADEETADTAGDADDAGVGANDHSADPGAAAAGAKAAARANRDDDDDSDESFLSYALASASSHALLFVFGLVLLGVWPRRVDALQRTLMSAPLRTFALGVLGALGALVLCVLLVITILGIPAAIVLALASALAMYAGVAASALAVGKLLPLPQLTDRPVLQLGAGVFLVFLVGLIPVLGPIVFVVAAALGVGAIVRTRLSETPPPDVTGGVGSVQQDTLVTGEPGL